MTIETDVADLKRRVAALEAAQHPATPPPGPPVPNPPPAGPPPPPPPGPRPAWGVPPGMTKLIDQDPSDSQKPWKLAPGADHVDIYFYAPASYGVTPEWLGYIKNGAALWNQSPMLNCIVTQTPPTAGKNRVDVKINDGGGDDGNFDPGSESGGFTSGLGEIQILKSLKGGPGGGERQNVTTHEMGHAVGLAHRKTKRVLMNGDTYSDVFTPDDIDRKNLLFLYGRQR